MVAYGIKNTVTDTEYVSWYNKDKHKYVLFDVTKSKVIDGLNDILSLDDNSISDFIKCLLSNRLDISLILVKLNFDKYSLSSTKL